MTISAVLHSHLLEVGYVVRVDRGGMLEQLQGLLHLACRGQVLWIRIILRW
jgi:hypothetical protein